MRDRILRPIGWLALSIALATAACSNRTPVNPTQSPTPVAAPQADQTAARPGGPQPSPGTSDTPGAALRHHPPELFSKRLKEIGEGAQARVGLVFVDLDGGSRASYHADRRFESASLVKLPILVELFREFSTGRLHRDTEVTLEAEDRVGGSGRLKNEPDGSRWSLGTLAELMITESDNIASDLILKQLDRDALRAGLAQLGLNQTTVERRIFDFAAIDQGRDNLTSPADMALLLEALYRNRLPGSQPMLAILRATRRRDMIGLGLPPEAQVAHKTGELSGILHDAALVTTPQGSYLLILMASEVGDREAMVAYFNRASRQIYADYTKP